MFTKGTVDDLYHQVTPVLGRAPSAALTTASASFTGETQDQLAYSDRFRSGIAVASYTAVSKKASVGALKLSIEHGDTSTFGTAATFADGSTGVSGSFGTSTSAATQTGLKGSVVAPINIHKLKRYWRVNGAATFVAGSTGTANSVNPGVAIVLGGANGPTTPAS